MEGLDTEGQRVRRRRVLNNDVAEMEHETVEEPLALQTSKKSRACPLPKPGGLMGQVLGFKPEQSASQPSVRIEPRAGKDAGD